MDKKDIWSGFKNILAKTLPIAANAVVPGAGGIITGLVASVLGVENTPEALEAGLATASPEQIIDLKKMQMDNQERLLEIGMENDKSYLQDRQSARQREVDIVKSTGKKDINLYVLAWTIVVGFFVLIGMLMFVDLPKASIGPVNQLFGFLGAGFIGVTGYFFGSSKGSADKTKLLSVQGDKS